MSLRSEPTAEEERGKRAKSGKGPGQEKERKPHKMKEPKNKLNERGEKEMGKEKGQREGRPM